MTTNKVEFNITGSKKDFKPKSNESFYIDQPIFEVIIHCFVADRLEYNAYGPIRLLPNKVNEAIIKLEEIIQDIKRIQTRNNFSSFLKKYDGSDEYYIEYLVSKNKDWEINWEDEVKLLKMTLIELKTILEQCKQDNRSLWIQEV